MSTCLSVRTQKPKQAHVPSTAKFWTKTGNPKQVLPGWVSRSRGGEDSFVHIQLAITLSEQPSHPSPSSGLPCPELSCWLHHLDSDVLEGPRPPRARTPRAASSLPVQCVSQQSSSVVKLMHLGGLDQGLGTLGSCFNHVYEYFRD